MDRGQSDFRLLKDINAPAEQRRGIGTIFIRNPVKGVLPVAVNCLKAKVLVQDTQAEQVLLVGSGQNFLGSALDLSFARRNMVIEIDGFFLRDLMAWVFEKVIPRLDGVLYLFGKGWTILTLKIISGAFHMPGQIVEHVLRLRENKPLTAIKIHGRGVVNPAD